MSKVKYSHLIDYNELNEILVDKYPNHICPKCKKEGIIARCVETNYDEKHHVNVLLSFSVFCNECGECFGRWDNTNRQYLLGK